MQSVVKHHKIVADSTDNLYVMDVDEETNYRRENITDKTNVIDGAQSADQIQPDKGSKESLTQESVSAKRRRRRRKKKVKKKDEVQVTEHADVSNLDLFDGNQCAGTGCKLPEIEYVQESGSSAVKKLSSSNVGRNKEPPLDFQCHEHTVYPSDVSIPVSSELAADKSGSFGGGEFVPCSSQHACHPSLMTREKLVFGRRSSVRDRSMILQEGVCSVKGSSMRLPSSAKEIERLSNQNGKLTLIPPVVSSKRKLLVLDVNGLLAYVVMGGPKDYKEDICILGRAIFKRPHCDDFLRFCIQNFDVGIWSSRAKKVIARVVEYLFGDLKDKLLFCWDMMHSTQTGFKTLENIHKPLVCKELRKIWEPNDRSLPWKKGDYDSSNTLLLDDSPYKALLNPLHTAIFPKSYHYEDKNDNSLGPGGDIRVYLEGLLRAENVQTYVSQNPFGQSAINETSVCWEFYSEVLHNLSNRRESDNSFRPSTSAHRPSGNRFY